MWISRAAPGSQQDGGNFLRELNEGVESKTPFQRRGSGEGGMEREKKKNSWKDEKHSQLNGSPCFPGAKVETHVEYMI